MRIDTMMRTAALGLAMLAAGCATAPATVTPVAVSAVGEQQKLEQDRKAILAMTGNFKVTFDFRETVALAPGYELKKPKATGGEEIIRVVEDRGRFISLQHMLVSGEGKDAMVIKHWRQDWTYEPHDVLVFAGYNVWRTRAIKGSTKGEWKQEVFQVEDSPRYGAVGFWTHDNGVSQWTSSEEIRPLPRRDMTSRKDYDAVLATNRHVITPWGWVQEEDNTKLALHGGNKPVALAREVGVNTYVRSDAFSVKTGDDYWTATKGFWALIRADWAKLRAASMFGLTIQGEPSALYEPILDIADDVQAGKLTAEAGAEKARAVIAKFTTTDQRALDAQTRDVITVTATKRD